jgi:ABC-2 type transport system ATP-binding protein
VQNDFTQEETSHIKEAGIELLPVTVDDLCIYLTEKDKGGIDSVFSGK